MVASQLVDLELRGEKTFTYEVIGVDYEQTILNTRFTGLKLPDSHGLNITFRQARGEQFMVTSFSPLIDVDGKVNKVTKIKVLVNYASDLSGQDRDHLFANASVLRKRGVV